MKKNCRHIIGIDEAGRGPLAGPLVVGGIKIHSKFTVKSSKFFEGIRDSKQLTVQKREEWFKKLIANPRIEWAYAVISPKIIDRINILQSAHKGAYRVYKKLAGNCSRVSKPHLKNGFAGEIGRISSRDSRRRNDSYWKYDEFREGYRVEIRRLEPKRIFEMGFSCRAMLDGSLRLPAGVLHKVFIKGDERFSIIAAASIIAKVVRDRIMARLHKKYPMYGFDIHKGYGTSMHYARIKKFGISEIHRKTFRLI